MGTLEHLVNNLKLYVALTLVWGLATLLHLGGDSLHRFISGVFLLNVAITGVLLFRVVRMRRKQTRSDAAAIALIESIRRGGMGQLEPFVLYLRPFATDTANEQDISWRILFGRPFQMQTFDAVLDAAFEERAQIVGLGQRWSREGAGRIVTDDATWWDDAVLLMKHADLIFIVPSTSKKGTARELDALRKDMDLQLKTLFVVLPAAWRAGSEALEIYRTSHPDRFVKNPTEGFLYNYQGVTFPLDGLRRPNDLLVGTAALLPTKWVARVLRL